MRRPRRLSVVLRALSKRIRLSPNKLLLLGSRREKERISPRSKISPKARNNCPLVIHQKGHNQTLLKQAKAM